MGEASQSSDNKWQDEVLWITSWQTQLLLE
jgi:hypothetical protein